MTPYNPIIVGTRLDSRLVNHFFALSEPNFIQSWMNKKAFLLWKVKQSWSKLPAALYLQSLTPPQCECQLNFPLWNKFCQDRNHATEQNKSNSTSFGRPRKISLVKKLRPERLMDLERCMSGHLVVTRCYQADQQKLWISFTGLIGCK